MTIDPADETRSTAPTLDGRRFRDVTIDPQGDISDDTVFEYHETDLGEVWATYDGGSVRRGFLVGHRDGDTLVFRYVHLTDGRSTASGQCTSRVELMTDGRLRLHESWRWESKPGAGTSTLEELR